MFSQSTNLLCISLCRLYPDCDSHSPAFLNLFHSFRPSICSTVAFPHFGNSIMLPQFTLPFLQIQKRILIFIAKFTTILVLIGAVFKIIWEMFHGKKSLNLVLLLLLLNFFRGSMLTLMYLSLTVNMWSINPLYSFQVLELLS